MFSLYNDDQYFASTIIREKILNKEATYFMPTKYISYEAVKLAKFFSDHISSLADKNKVYRTFFASSHVEALYGTIKIIRHNSYRYGKKGLVLVINCSESVQHFFNPLQLGLKEQLIPDVVFTDNINYLVNENKQNISGVILCIDEATDIAEINKIMRISKEIGALFALDEARLLNWHQKHLQKNSLHCVPDIYIAGENLTNHEIPYGSFSMQAKIYKPWNNIRHCLNHSSSNSGNTLTLSAILSLLNKYGLISQEQLVKKGMDWRIKGYAKYVNPIISLLFDVTKLSPEIVSAYQNTLICFKGKKEYKIIDAVGGSGCSLRGHNSQDILYEVLDKHDSSVNYWQELAKKLCELSNLAHAFPSVSGSTAVDQAIIIALLASPKKRKIITFSYNYAGKSLIALNLTRYQTYQQPFAPLYDSIIEVDPFSKESSSYFVKSCADGDVALVWFEVMQGNDLREIPQELINTILKCREKFGFFIGVDEILTGMYRTGTFLYAHQRNIPYDIVTIGKGLTDMTFPQGAVLVSANVYQKALSQNKQLVESLSAYYRNQLGSHIALHALSKVEQEQISKRVHRNGDMLKERLSHIAKSTGFISEIRGHGMILYLTLNPEMLAIKVFGVEITEFLLSSYYLEHGNILLLNSRMTPSLYLSNIEITNLCNAIEKVTTKPKLYFFLFCLTKALKFYSYLFFKKLLRLI